MLYMLFLAIALTDTCGFRLSNVSLALIRSPDTYTHTHTKYCVRLVCISQRCETLLRIARQSEMN